MVEEVEFPVWLENQLLMRGWRPIDLANAANLPNATIVRILNGDRKAGVDSATAIARALNMEPESVFRRAGLLPPKREGNDEINEPTFREILEVVRGMSVADRKEVLTFALFRFRRQQEQEE